MKEGWKICKFKDVAEIVGGSTPKTNVPEYWGEGYYWVSPAELKGEKYIGKTERTITEEAIKHTNLSLLPVGTVLLSSRAPIGKVAITTEPMYCNQGFKNVVCGADLYNEFVYYYLKHNVDYLNSLGSGATFKEISKRVVENVSVPVPPITEQEHIVAELDLLSDIIEKKKAQLKELDNLAQSIFYDMFGDPIANEKGWETTTVGNVCKLKSGNSNANNAPAGDLPYVKVGDMNLKGNEEFITTSSQFVDREFCKKDIFPIGTVIFPKRGGAIFTNKKRQTAVEICCDLNTMGVIPSGEVLSSYIFAYFKLIDFGKICNGAAIPQLNNCDIAPLPIVLPPIDLQRAFAAKIETIEQQKAVIQKSIEETQTLFNSRMDFYFN